MHERDPAQAAPREREPGEPEMARSNAPLGARDESDPEHKRNQAIMEFARRMDRVLLSLTRKARPAKGGENHGK